MNALSEIPPEDGKAGTGENWRCIGDLALAAIQKKARQYADARATIATASEVALTNRLKNDWAEQ